MYQIGFVRSTSYKVKNNSYNVQEIGLANELSKLNLKVDVYLISDRDETYIEKCGFNDNVTVYWLKGISIPGRQAYYKELNYFLKKKKYDLIWALDDSQITTVLVSKYCKKNNIKFVLWQGMYENYPEKYKRLIQYIFDFTLLKTLIKNTRYTISKTTLAQKYLISKKFPSGKVIPVALETKNFENQIKTDFRKELKIANEKKIILYIGKVEERRKPIFCIDVYKYVKENNDKTCLVYVGNGPLINEVKEYVFLNNIKDVYFIDKINQNQLPSLYSISDIFILTTRYEIFGMVLLESMYFGVPVITYKAAGPLDVISHNKDGFIMDNFNEEKWASVILNYINKDNVNMKKNCINKIKGKYLWNVIANKYYNEIIKIINDK